MKSSFLLSLSAALLLSACSSSALPPNVGSENTSPANAIAKGSGKTDPPSASEGSTATATGPTLPSGYTKLSGIKSVALGGMHGCALAIDGTVWCWGSNTYGELGYGSEPSGHLARAVPGISGAIQVAVGESHSCALLGSGQVYCWGLNQYGALGDGRGGIEPLLHLDYQDVSAIPVLAVASGVRQLVSSERRTCVLLSNGAVSCWGMAGIQPTRYDNTPVSQPGPPLQTLAISDENFLGPGDLGQRAYVSSLAAASRVPIALPAKSSGQWIVAAAMGWNHACLLDANGDVSCAGDNASGQLGQGNVAPPSTEPLDWAHLVPQKVPGLPAVLRLAAGRDHTCVIDTNHAVECWGDNDWHQLQWLGDDTITPRSIPTPIKIENLAGAQEIATAETHSCVVLKDGTVKCWGDNHDSSLGCEPPATPAPDGFDLRTDPCDVLLAKP